MGSYLGTVIKVSIADTKINKTLKTQIETKYGLQNLKDQLKITLDGEAALHISGIISGATDNAKELIMAKINAIEDLTSIHLYLMALGFTSEEVALYMNLDLPTWLVKQINKTNTLEGVEKPLLQHLVEKYKETASDKGYVESFLDIYQGAQEFSDLAKILKINQRTSADIQSIFLYLNKLNKAMYKREHSVLGKGLKDFQDGKNLSKHIKKIIDANPNTLSEEQVINILQKCSNIPVKFINSNGEVESKIVSLQGGQFDFRYYTFPDNELYRQAAIQYYNLFKNTINVFDIIENSPVFKSMIQGLGITHNKNLIVSKKYNFLFNTSLDIFRQKADEIFNNNKSKVSAVKTIYGNSALPVDVKEPEIKKLIRTFDNFMVAFWVREKLPNFRFSVKELLNQLNSDESFSFSTDNQAKLFPATADNPFMKS